MGALTMISIRAVLLGVLAVAVFAPQAAAKVNIIYPPKRGVARQLEAPPVERKQTKISQAVTIVMVQNRDRFSRQELLARQLFRTWTGFIGVYSGPRYPDEWQAPRYPF
jgi:hypothetical protein